MKLNREQLKLSFVVIFVLLITSGIVRPQQSTPVSPIPKPDAPACTMDKWNAGDKACELSRLRVRASLDDVKFAWNAYQQALQGLSTQAELAKTDNGWAKDAQFDMNSMTFKTPPPPPPPAPATPAKDEKKPEPKKQ